ncbi:MAG: hypothetical protein E4H36_04455 [Spirochaetales bacterium]|nr:MAG: hypothetical protein E4H36_04455 [Spirochaetales bacterium]
MKTLINTLPARAALPALAVITTLVTIAILALTGCTYYVIPGEEEASLTAADSRVAYDVTVTLASSAKTQPFNPGDSLTITWESGATFTAVNLDLYRGEDFTTAIAAAYSKSSSFTWTIPAGLPADETYRIKVTGVSGNKSGELYGFSAYFAISEKPESGLSDVIVSRTDITLTLTDNGSLVDGDRVTVKLNGAVIADNHVLAAPPGTEIAVSLSSGANSLEIYAVNEGEVSPNTALLAISHVTAGEANQQWRLYAGETGSLTISAP